MHFASAIFPYKERRASGKKITHLQNRVQGFHFSDNFKRWIAIPVNLRGLKNFNTYSYHTSHWRGKKKNHVNNFFNWIRFEKIYCKKGIKRKIMLISISDSFVFFFFLFYMKRRLLCIKRPASIPIRPFSSKSFKCFWVTDRRRILCEKWMPTRTLLKHFRKNTLITCQWNAFFLHLHLLSLNCYCLIDCSNKLYANLNVIHRSIYR